MATAADFSGLFGGTLTPEEQQRQLTEARAAQFASMAPSQQLAFMGYKAGAGLGEGLAQAAGVDIQDPTIKRAAALRQLAQGIDPNSVEGLTEYAQRLARAGFNAEAYQISDKIRAARKTEADISKAYKESLTPEQRNAAAIADASGAPRGSTLWNQTYKESIGKLTTKEGTTSDFERILDKLDITSEEKNKLQLQFIESKIKPAQQSEFERLLKSMGLTPEQEMKFKQQRLDALSNPDPSGLKALSADLKAAQIGAINLKNEALDEKRRENIQLSVNKLSTVETDLYDALQTGAKALKLAPTDFIGASQQALFKNIPWTDAKALNNLVSSLNSEKAINTLNELKTQSKTGATGFGALNKSELQLIIDKTRALDPQDKMFKENLTYVLNGWSKLRNQTQESRIQLQGNTPKLKELKTLIAAARAKGSITAEEKSKIEALKAEIGVE
jgi:hypothetical protein